MANAMPPAETDISVEIVRALLDEQHPDLAELELRFENNGWDSAIFRLGGDLAVRLPRRQVNADLLPDELYWLPRLASQLPLPINAAVRVGQPGCGFPWMWSIAQWFDGVSWADAGVRDAHEAAATLGWFVRELGVEAPEDAPSNPYRGGPLTDRDPALRDRVAQLGDSIDTAAVVGLWEDALAAPVNVRRRWLHGDLHPANVIVNDGQLAAVIDWVDLGAGDTAYDLAAAWFCFSDQSARASFVDATGETDEATWVRARACALSHGIACLASSADNPRMHIVGQRTLDAVLADS
ncbi:MAG: aminoglycoside phosphotransferase family protein [Acidimicrobiales bacterium]|nr:aminoglycoside phosphotransferase family protein [Acidimicrobiales bacterium]